MFLYFSVGGPLYWPTYTPLAVAPQARLCFLAVNTAPVPGRETFDVGEWLTSAKLICYPAANSAHTDYARQPLSGLAFVSIAKGCSIGRIGNLHTYTQLSPFQTDFVKRASRGVSVGCVMIGCDTARYGIPGSIEKIPPLKKYPLFRG